MTFSRVLADTLAPGVKVRETADWDTPAKRATSIDEANFFLTSPTFIAPRLPPSCLALANSLKIGDLPAILHPAYQPVANLCKKSLETEAGGTKRQESTAASLPVVPADRKPERRMKVKLANAPVSWGV